MSKRGAIYARVSTSNRGQDICNQVDPIKSYCERQSVIVYKTYEDIRISGAKDRRPGLDLLIDDARKGQFNTVVVTEFSRLARNTRHLLNLLHELQQLSITVVSLREGFNSDTSMGRAMIAVCGILGAMERDLLAERIRTSLARKREEAARKGQRFNIGRPVILDDDMITRIHKLNQIGESILRIAKILGVSKSTVQRGLKGVQNHDNEFMSKGVPINVPELLFTIT